jgi:hypothetical protein
MVKMGREKKAAPYILRGFLKMDERFFTKEQSTSAEQEERLALRDIKTRRAESEESDAQEYSAVLARIQSGNEGELTTSVVFESEDVVTAASQEVQILQLISEEEAADNPKNSIAWLRASQRRIKNLNRAA